MTSTLKDERHSQNPMLLNQASIWLMERFSVEANIDDLNQAVCGWRRALKFIQGDLQRRVGYSSNLARALRSRAKRACSGEDLQEAMKLVEEALSDMPQGEGAELNALFGGLLKARFDLVSYNVSDLEQAVSLYKRALALPHFETSEASILNDLGIALTSLGVATNCIEHLDQAMSIQRLALSKMAAETALGLMTKANLGTAMRARCALTEESDAHAEIVKLYNSIIEDAVESLPEVALLAARDWADWEYKRGSWHNAAAAYAHVRAASERILAAQTSRAGSELWLAESQSVFARAAFAAAQLGNWREAVAFLECGSARLLSNQLRLIDRRLRELEGAGFASLKTSLDANVEELRHLSALAGSQELSAEGVRSQIELERLRASRERLNQSIAATSDVPGFTGVFSFPTVEAIRAAAGNEDVIYIAATPRAGLAIRLPAEPTEEGEVVWLPDLQEIDVRMRVKEYLLTRAALLENLPLFSIIHMSCHAQSNYSAPLQSSLLLAQDEKVRLEDLLELRMDNVRLAILSACETAIPGQDLPDEVVSLSTGFLFAGVAGCIATLWPVSDLASMLVMSRFYWNWQASTILPSEALRRAQVWVRDTDNREKICFLEEVSAMISAEEGRSALSASRKVLRFLPANETTFDHPFFWGAFTYSGS
jgi:tetratricopeptide (TPR) repeat protein